MKAWTIQLEAKLTEFWSTEEEDWDKRIKGAKALGAEAFGGMPQVDSKAISRASPIFEEVLGIKLSVSLIRPGGYPSIEEAIKDLVPKMVEKAIRKRQPSRKKLNRKKESKT